MAMRWGPKVPKLRTAEVVVWIYRQRGGSFTIRDIVQEFEIGRGDARQRVLYMIHLWGAAKEVGRLKAHRRGRREVQYELTKWGERYAAGQLKGRRRLAANK